MLRRLPLVLLLFTAGCVVTQPQGTPVAELRLKEAQTQRGYWLYVPSTYTSDRSWPLVITLHGARGWDNAKSQIREWKALAEDRGLIVAAPELLSTGTLPLGVGGSAKDLARDEQVLLGVLDDIGRRYNVDRANVLLTGFGGGGYPLYYVGLRHPERFSMLVAREASFKPELLDSLECTDAMRQMPIMIFWGKDEFVTIQNQSWAAYRYLREKRFFNTRHKEIEGGHLRRPGLVYRFWAESQQRLRSGG